jgi:hypothetical protein
VIRPEESASSLGATSAWHVVQPAELAVLGESLRRWPSVVDALLRRAADRTHGLTVQLAIADMRRAEDRLLGLFRALADRCPAPPPAGGPAAPDGARSLAARRRVRTPGAEPGGLIRSAAEPHV